MKRYIIPIAVLAACGSCAVQAANQTIPWKPIPYFKGSDPLHAFVKPDSAVKTIWECDATSKQSNCNAKPERITMPVKKSMGAVLPPPEYDKPYTGKLVVVEMDSQDKIRRACPNTKFPDDYALGCTIKYPDRCVVYIVNEEEMAKTRFTTRVVMRHERGHCNGWSAEHLNSRVPTAAEY